MYNNNPYTMYCGIEGVPIQQKLPPRPQQSFCLLINYTIFRAGGAISDLWMLQGIIRSKFVWRKSHSYEVTIKQGVFQRPEHPCFLCLWIILPFVVTITMPHNTFVIMNYLIIIHDYQLISWAQTTSIKSLNKER